MKKLFLLLCLAATLIYFCGCEKKDTHSVYELYISAHLISNDSVGNNWSISYTCDGEIIKSGKRFSASSDTPQNKLINIRITEKDKISDIGTGSIAIELNDNAKEKTVIAVTEKGGRYQGNEALWEITCEVKLLELT